jgi:FkbM family methyltransferase
VKPVFTLVPDRPAIELVAYYQQFIEYYPECELRTKRWFVEHVQPNWVMFDAGANIGYYSILFSRLAPQGRVYAFEPTETMDLLRANLDHNGCRNVTSLKLALGDFAGRREDNIFRIWGTEPEHHAYDFTTVDEMVQQLALERLDCIKIDVDSFDFDVLRGSEKTLRELDPWVVVELNDALAKRNQSVPQALEWLYSLGYRRAHVIDYENYVLRRDARNLEPYAPIHPEIRLSFENRPLIMAPKVKKTKLIEGVFENEPRRHNSATIGQKNAAASLCISVAAPRWSYAASWPRAAKKLPSGPIIIEVDMLVRGGAVGIGCVGHDETSYVGEEVALKPASALQTATISADDVAEVGDLVLRNVDPHDCGASVELEAIRVYAGVPVEGLVSTALTAGKQRISIAECSAVLNGQEPFPDSALPAVPGIDIVPIEELGSALGFSQAFVSNVAVYRRGFLDVKAEIDESILAFVYQNFEPQRHLEFGFWKTPVHLLCGRLRRAEISTINLAHEWEGSTPPYPPAAFDTVLINGDHSTAAVTKATNHAVTLTRQGGLVMWHNFCPDADTISRNAASRAAVTAIVENFASWGPAMSELFWVRPSHILIGVKA